MCCKESLIGESIPVNSISSMNFGFEFLEYNYVCIQTVPPKNQAPSWYTFTFKHPTKDKSGRYTLVFSYEGAETSVDFDINFPGRKNLARGFANLPLLDVPSQTCLENDKYFLSSFFLSFCFCF